MNEIKGASFSVVMPLYNKSQFVRASLEAVLAQTFTEFEVLIVDDGSTDDGVDAIADLLSTKVRVMRQSNAGPGVARNHGILEAKHDWIALLDADDLWMPDHLAALKELIEEFPDIDLATTGFSRSEAGRVAKERPGCAVNGYRLNYFRERAHREVVWSSSVAIRRSAFLRTNGFGDFFPGEDSEFWARFALDHLCAATRKVTALYVVSTGGIMDTSQANSGGVHDSSNPLLVTLDKALNNQNYEDKHSDISKYLTSLVSRDIRHALYRGDRSSALSAIERLPLPLDRRDAFFRMLAMLPAPILKAGIKGFSGIKKLRL